MHSVFFFQAEDGIRDLTVTGVQTCALPISWPGVPRGCHDGHVVAPARELFGKAARVVADAARQLARRVGRAHHHDAHAGAREASARRQIRPGARASRPSGEAGCVTAAYATPCSGAPGPTSRAAGVEKLAGPSPADSPPGPAAGRSPPGGRGTVAHGRSSRTSRTAAEPGRTPPGDRTPRLPTRRPG